MDYDITYFIAARNEIGKSCLAGWEDDDHLMILSHLFWALMQG